ncbi:hypothetical protein, partial [Streptomyces zhihengii]|uniref:hypothetical protein n=1 Tax=Streptomyces zhihengii TaxID=1818004 RepID=UPI0033A33E21
MSENESPEVYDADRIRRAVMLPGFDAGRREDVPQVFLDAFGTDDGTRTAAAPVAEAEPVPSVAREEDDATGVRPAADEEARSAGRHRQRNRRRRGPAHAP